MQSNPFNKQNFNLTAATRFGKLGRWNQWLDDSRQWSHFDGGLIAFDGGRMSGGKQKNSTKKWELRLVEVNYGKLKC